MPSVLNLGLARLFFPALIRDNRQYQALSEAQSDWRMREKAEQRDLFGALLDARDPETGKGLPHEELVAEAGLLIIAGSDTMATGVSSTIFYILHYPATYARLQEEIRTTFENAEEIRMGPRLNSCHYLFACIDESMRLSPGVGSILPREILPGGLTIDGEWFPAGTDVGLPHYALHHNEAYHPEPFEFVPDRWILTAPGSTTHAKSEAEVTLARSAFCPFSFGRASCVAKTLSYQEMAIMLGRIVWLYDMRTEPGSLVGEGHASLGLGRTRKNEYQTWDSFVSIHNGPMVQFKRRL